MKRNVLSLVKIMLVIPISSAWAERGFPRLKRVKTDFRSSLTAPVLTDLMYVILSTETVRTFDPKPSVMLWWKGGKQCRGVVEKFRQRNLSVTNLKQTVHQILNDKLVTKDCFLKEEFSRKNKKIRIYCDIHLHAA